MYRAPCRPGETNRHNFIVIGQDEAHFGTRKINSPHRRKVPQLWDSLTCVLYINDTDRYRKIFVEDPLADIAHSIAHVVIT